MEVIHVGPNDEYEAQSNVLKSSAIIEPFLVQSVE
jgi:hypothetical protein